MAKMDVASAIDKIDKAGVLLVFPITNQKKPTSLWSEFFPRTKMRWEWDEAGDRRVGDLWHLRTELSECAEVVYAKWYRGRATFFSRDIFAAFLSQLQTVTGPQKPVSETAQRLLEILQEDSPQSPRFLREATDLQGRMFESAFNKGLKELWIRLLIVGFGEIDDGAFPSLALGASRLLYEDLWDEARSMTPQKSRALIEKKLGNDNLFLKFLDRTKKQLHASPATPRYQKPEADVGWSAK